MQNENSRELQNWNIFVRGPYYNRKPFFRPGTRNISRVFFCRGPPSTFSWAPAGPETRKTGRSVTRLYEEKNIFNFPPGTHREQRQYVSHVWLPGGWTRVSDSYIRCTWTKRVITDDGRNLRLEVVRQIPKTKTTEEFKKKKNLKTRRNKNTPSYKQPKYIAYCLPSVSVKLFLFFFFHNSNVFSLFFLRFK